MSEKFCLKWNDFHSNVSKSFGLFRHEDYLHDVTLVSDDNKQISAHKLVLSSCSEYFKSIFKHNSKPNVHPLLCLDGITAEDLKNIMDYIYNGEVNIFQDGLDRFLGVAQRLKLEGLMGNDEPPKEEEQKNYMEAQTFSDEAMVENSDDTDNKTIKKSTVRTMAKVDKVIAPIHASDNANVNEVRNAVQQYIETDSNGKFKCTICGKEAPGNYDTGAGRSKARCNLENHIETHLEGLSFPCQLCGKTFRSRNALAKHKSIHYK